MTASDWNLSLAFLAACLVVGHSMKWISVFLPRYRLMQNRMPFMLSIYPSMRTYLLAKNHSNYGRHLPAKMLALIAAFILTYAWYRPLVFAETNDKILIAYLFLPPFIIAMFGLEFLMTSLPIIPLHNSPWLSRNLGEFWGKRWNRWVGDWLRDIAESFSVSTTRGLFLAFFLLHALLVYFDRRATMLKPWQRLSICWLVLTGGFPLFCNEAFLGIVHFLP